MGRRRGNFFVLLIKRNRGSHLFTRTSLASQFYTNETESEPDYSAQIEVNASETLAKLAKFESLTLAAHSTPLSHFLSHTTLRSLSRQTTLPSTQGHMRLTRLTSPLSPFIDSAPSSHQTDPIYSPSLSQDYPKELKEYILNTMQQQQQQRGQAVMLQDGGNQWPAPYPYPPDDSPDDGGGGGGNYPTSFPNPRRDSDAVRLSLVTTKR